MYLYERAEDPQRPPERKIISALYLETLHPESVQPHPPHAAAKRRNGHNGARYLEPGRYSGCTVQKHYLPFLKDVRQHIVLFSYPFVKVLRAAEFITGEVEYFHTLSYCLKFADASTTRLYRAMGKEAGHLILPLGGLNPAMASIMN